MKKLICIVLIFVMVFSLPLSVSAADNVEDQGTVKVHGIIQNTSETYDISFDTDVNWYVTTQSYPKVQNSVEKDDSGVLPYTITNNTDGTEIKVSLDSFAGDDIADSIEEKLNLYLTGSLGANDMDKINLAKGYDGTKIYETTLESGPSNAWSYGFTGEYSGNINREAVTPTYTMIMHFAFF